MLYKIWQPCSLETFLNVTIRFPSTDNMGKDTKTISVGQLCPKLCGKIVKTAEKGNLATLLYKIWQPCSLETFLNITIRFPSTENMGKDTKTISVGQLCSKLCGKIVKTAEKCNLSPLYLYFMPL